MNRYDIRDERGIAMVTAVLIMFVIVILTGMALRLGTHDVQQSSQNRQRIQSVAAAEAGIDFIYSRIQASLPADLPCGHQAPMGVAPGASYNAQVTYYAANGSVIPCPIPFNAATQQPVPARALISSVGRGMTPTSRRRMEALVDLIPIRGGLVTSSALYSDQHINFSSNTTLKGVDGPADVYTAGTFTGATNQTIQGNIYAQIDINVSGSGGGAHLTRNAHALRHINISQGYNIRGDVVATQGNIVVGGPVDGNASAGGTITPSNPPVAGFVRQNQTGLAPPPTRTFPNRAYDPDAYTAAGYTNQRSYTGATACTAAASYLSGTGAGTYGAQNAKTVIRIQDNCTLTILSSFGVRNDLAILANGAVDLQGGMTLVGTGPYNVIIDTGLNSALTCTPTTSTSGTLDPRSFRLRSNTQIVANLRTVIRSGCNAHFASNAFIHDGQIFARGFVNLSSNTTMTFFRVEVPGDEVSGFRQDIIYTREVQVS